MDKHIFSVGAITRLIKQELEDSFSDVWIEGEVSNFVRHSSGHMYFTLKDAEAQIPVVMFRHLNRSLSFAMENGLQIIIRGRVSVYEKRGSYQFYAEVIEPKGLGALQLAFEQLKEKLREEGLFDDARKKKLPLVPRVIGIVTSPTGAAIRDILQIVDRRFSNVHIILNPVKVQGDGAAHEIAAAIDALNSLGTCDCMIVGRGGGSLEDLWAFNEEIVARAIARSEVPIVSAVGHEIDYTISDFVADLRAPTPSAAAELVVVCKDEWDAKVTDFVARLHAAMQTLLADGHRRLDACRNHRIFRQPHMLAAPHAQQLDELSRRLYNTTCLFLERKQNMFHQVVGKLDMLSPLGVLARGYSVSVHEKTGSVLKESADIAIGDRVRTRLHKGEVTSEVISVKGSAV